MMFRFRNEKISLQVFFDIKEGAEPKFPAKMSVLFSAPDWQPACFRN